MTLDELLEVVRRMQLIRAEVRALMMAVTVEPNDRLSPRAEQQ